MRYFEAFFLVACLFQSAPADRPNILFIAVDDLVPVLGCYGDETMLANNGTPHIDSLASQGTVFLNHHVQFPVCGPSRAALTTGLMPDETGVRGFQAIRHPDNLPDVITLPQHFKNQGYETACRGKFHDNRTVGDTSQALGDNDQYPDGKNIDDPLSWSIPYAGGSSGNSGTGMTGRPAAFAGLDSGSYGDEGVLTGGKALLDTLESGDKPFFLAVGFYKPHLPFLAPQRYWDVHDVNENGQFDDDLDIPAFRSAPLNAGAETVEMLGFNNELLGYEPHDTTGLPEGNEIRFLRHGYYACVTMIDDLAGELLAHLATKNDPVQPGKTMDETTIIVFWGDHGFSLGEHNRWGKHVGEELSSWAPLIIFDPRNPGGGAQTMTPVNSIDLYPTLCELAGLPLPTQPQDTGTLTGRPLRGRSLVPILTDPEQAVNGGALIQKNMSGNSFMYRTDEYRLIEHYGGVLDVERELYALGRDRVETENLAGDPAYAAVLHELSSSMRRETASQGVTTLQNEDAATSPTDTTLPAIAGQITDSGFQLSWPSTSSAGSVYTLLSTEDLLLPFTEHAGIDALAVGRVEVALTDSLRFFRVALDDLQAPAFPVDPLTSATATEGQAYSASISGAAVDTDAVSYALTAGPAWLTVSTGGALGGTPSASDSGANWFTVSATDTTGLQTRARLVVEVLPPPTTPALLEAWSFAESTAGEGPDDVYAGELQFGSTFAGDVSDGTHWIISGNSGTYTRSSSDFTTAPDTGRFRWEVQFAGWTVDPASAGDILRFTLQSPGGTENLANLFLEITATGVLARASTSSGFRTLAELGLTEGPHTLAMEIDLDARTAEYFFDGSSTHSFSGAFAAGEIGRVRIQKSGSWATSATTIRAASFQLERFQ